MRFKIQINKNIHMALLAAQHRTYRARGVGVCVCGIRCELRVLCTKNLSDEHFNKWLGRCVRIENTFRSAANCAREEK